MVEYAPLEIREKKADFPLIQGGMGIGISLGGLAGAVAKEGAVGIISAAQIGFCEPDFDKEPFKANLRAIRSEFAKARETAPDGVIGFNIMVAMNHYEDYVREAIAAGADLIISGAGLPTDLPKYAEGSSAALAPIVSTNKSASVILKCWDKKYNRVPDLLIIEGPKAGGHLGFTKDQLAVFDEDTYRQEVKQILETVKIYEEKYKKKIPTALAGGINSPEKVQEAFDLGADAVQCATCFVPTWECDADIRYKEAYVAAKKEDIRIVKSPVGMPGRAIYNAFMEKAEAGEKKVHKCHGCLSKCKPAEIPYCITDALIHAAKGETDEALLFCGADAYKVKEIRSVKQVVEELFGMVEKRD